MYSIAVTDRVKNHTRYSGRPREHGNIENTITKSQIIIMMVCSPTHGVPICLMFRLYGMCSSILLTGKTNLTLVYK